jgi:hypothetical protein
MVAAKKHVPIVKKRTKKFNRYGSSTKQWRITDATVAG